MAFKHTVKYLLFMLKYPTALPVIVKMMLSMAIIMSASTVLIGINRSQRETQTQHLFFIANVMVANVLAVTARSVVACATVHKITHPDVNVIRCKILCLWRFIPAVASFLIIVVLCLDRMFTVMAPGAYKTIVTRKLASIIVATIWIMSCAVSYVGLSGFRLTDKDGTCNTEYFEEFEIKAVVLPMVISGVLAAIHNTFIFYKVFTTTALDPKLNKGHSYRMARFHKAWKIYKETQPTSITLLTLGMYNIGISITAGLVQSYADRFLVNSVISFCAYIIVDISMLIQALLYVKFLHTIKEWLWFKCRRH